MISSIVPVIHNAGGGGGVGNRHMKGVGMLVGNFELNPLRRPIWAWPKLFLSPKRDHVIGYIFIFFPVQP